MKKIMLAIVAVVLTTGTAFCQFNFGAKAGLNMFKVAAEEGDDLDMKAGFHLGILGHIHISDQFAIQPEVVYSVQGGKSDGNGDDTKLNLNYVNIPLLFQYMFDNGFRIQAGPQLGVLTSAKAKADGNSIDVKDAFKSIEIGLPVGVGFVSSSGFGVDARYHFGITNISESDDNKAFNRGFQVGVFYLLQHD